MLFHLGLRKRWRFGLEIPLLLRLSSHVQDMALHDLLFLLNRSDTISSEEKRFMIFCKEEAL